MNNLHKNIFQYCFYIFLHDENELDNKNYINNTIIKSVSIDDR